MRAVEDGEFEEATVTAVGATVRFVHTSDWQLGMTRHFLEGEAQARYAAARLDAVRAIGALVAARGCQFVLVAGDVFDSNLLASQVVRRALDVLSEIEVPVYLLPGNHDAYNAATIYRSGVFAAECPPNVHVLDSPGPVPLPFAGVELVAAPLMTNAPLVDPTAAALAGLSADGTRRILVGHGQVDEIAPDLPVSAIRLAALETALEDGRLHYVALGDRHSRLSLGETGRVHYCGSPEVTSFRDQMPGDVLVVDLDAEGRVRVDPVHVGRWSFRDVTYDVSSADDIATIDAELAGIRAADRTVVRHALRGTLSLTDHAALQDVLARHRDRFAGCFAWDRYTDLVVHVDGAELSELGVAGYVGDAVHELGRAAEVDSQAGDALALLYRLARAGTR